MRLHFTLSLLSILVLTSACTTTQQTTELEEEVTVQHSEADESLSATLWVQRAAEYDAITRLVYNTAGRQLAARINDSTFTASVEQTAGFDTLSPAIILDVDETVLDNSPFQARMIRQGQKYSSSSWKEWVNEAQAEPLEGAVPFLKKAETAGVAIFYVTNRDADLEEATIENLKRYGLNATSENVILRGERPEWTSDKASRRKFVAASHRIIMLFGDDLNDFISAKKISESERSEAISQYDDRWGTSWFILPNPIYGSWRDAMPMPGDTYEQRLELLNEMRLKAYEEAVDDANQMEG